MALKDRATEALQTYRRKRDFSKTSEPSGAEKHPAGNALSFVIQKHDASHLHYDFRLELDGVLKSWAVAKGPSLNPHEKRLAVEVEDHPLAYGGFEGIIPQGQYGGGTVMLWDRGTWEPLGDSHEGLKKGELKFLLHGEKLTGKWVLIRMPPRPKDRHPNWLLIKEKDEVARPEGPSLPENDDESVLSKRTLAAIAADGDRVWQTRAAGSQPAKSKVTRTGKGLAFIKPELATLAESVPPGKDWLYEIKFDGYRVVASLDKKGVTLFTRTGLDWTARFPEIAEALAPIPNSAIIDGEIVVLREDGVSDFARLQERLTGEKEHELTFFVFDLLHLDGTDLRDRPLIERKEKLKTLLASIKKRIIYTDHIRDTGATFLEHACKAGLEGIICKPANAPYRSGRVGDWLKVKCGHRQEFVIGGFVPPTSGMKGIGSLSVGTYQDGKLVYAGRVGTGYSEKIGRDLRQRLDKLITKEQPFAGKLPSEARRGAIWVKPELVAEIAYGTITPDGIVRHGSFKGLREDKPSREIMMETTAKTAVPSPSKHNVRRGESSDVAGIAITHPDKILDPESGLTKLLLAQYYADIADWILPQLVDRPISIVRCPEGDTKPCFYQRHVAVGLPPDVYAVHPDAAGKETYLAIKDIKGLVSLVQIGALEIHPWGARTETANYPDRLIFDFDPDPLVGWDKVVEAAFACRDRLKKLKLTSFVKTTGGKGLHVVVPLQPKVSWDVAKPFAQKFAKDWANEFPNQFIAVMSKKERQGKIFIDYLRNDRTATAVAPYSTRARTGAPVSTPIAWSELSADLNPKTFTIESVRARLAGLKKDPWQEFWETRQNLS